MAVEIERKYLVNKTRWKDAYKDEKQSIEQGYIVNSEEKTVRVRIYGSQGFITIKGSVKGVSRPEFEYVIPVEDARQLIDQFCSSVVSKIRHKVRYKNKLWEVDEFLGENQGLLMAEIELDDEQAPFELPDWISNEVTGDKRFYNSYLSTHPFSTWDKGQ
jgi:adenylate cyclase